MMMYHPLFVSVIVFFTFKFSVAQVADYCRTPNREQGECMVITSCEPLYNILKERPISSYNADLLRRSQCGFVGTLPKVCCPLGTQPVQPSTEEPEFVPPAEGEFIESNLLPPTNVCGTGTQDKIYGGQKAQLDEFPWMALVEYLKPNGQKGFYCGGVLINSKYILTAAHCLKGKDLPKNWQIVSVRLGEYNTDTDVDCVVTKNNRQLCAPPAVNVPVEDRIAHEEYQPQDINQYHDIALLRLAREVKFSDYIRPICLPRVPTLLSKSYVNKNLIVAGWGKTENRSESNIKLKLEVPVKSDSVCTNTYTRARVQLNGDYQICAGGRSGQDSCRGDSGGPLMTLDTSGGSEINWYSIGVVSFGPSPCGMENWPGVYTKVANYMPWIVQKLKP